MHITVCITTKAGGGNTWRDKESPPQLLITRNISDLPRHVDKPSCHRGHPSEVEDPEERETHTEMKVIIEYLTASCGFWKDKDR